MCKLIYYIVLHFIKIWRQREGEREGRGSFSKSVTLWEKKFFLEDFINTNRLNGLLILEKSYLFLSRIYVLKRGKILPLYFFVYINSLRCKGQGATNREKLHGMHDVRLLLVFPFVGRIPDTWPTLLRRNSRNTRSRSHLLVSKSPICVRRQDGSSASSYDAAKILPIHYDRQSKKKTLRRQVTSKIAGETACDSEGSDFYKSDLVCFCRSSFKPRRNKLVNAFSF